jgi:CRISPR-associated protein Cas1
MDEHGDVSPDATPSQAEERLLPARMLNELVYCPRLFWLEHVAGEWEDNSDTVAGKSVHRRVDRKVDEFAPADQLAPDLVKARSVTVASIEEGVVAKVDLLEAEGGIVTPVDYKRGSPPPPGRYPGDVWPADRVQSAAQVLALRASGYHSDQAVVYYAASKTRVQMPVDDGAIAQVRWAVAEARRVSDIAIPPPPLMDSPKCPRCSIVNICLPDETNALTRGGDAAPVRPLITRDHDARPCHVQAHGAVVGKAGEVLEIRLRDEPKKEVRLKDVSHLSVFGNVQLTPSAIRELCDRDIGVSFFSYGGWYCGALGGVSTASVYTRLAQFKHAQEPELALGLARCFVEGKILNCRTLLRRNREEGEDAVLVRLRDFAADARRATSIESLLGIEGMAARLYFAEFKKLIRPRSGAAGDFDFDGRNRRPPKDPINALLSLAYAMLVKDARVALGSVGFDPTVGFLHQPRPGRPALALDLMEEFRPLVADSTVLTTVNTEAVQAHHFIRAAGGVALNDAGRRAFLESYERRMSQEITHPLFGYKVTYRRVLEVQARLLARTLLGELPEYPSFRTR